MITIICIVLAAVALLAVILLMREHSSAAVRAEEVRTRAEEVRVLSEQSRSLSEQIKVLTDEASDLRVENARLQERISQLQSSLDNKEEDRRRFNDLARQSLLDNSRLLMEQNSASVRAALQPMAENIENFRRSVAERNERESSERINLAERVRELTQSSAAVGLEARRLTDALKGNAKLQGEWGEMILDNILERSGMQRGRDYVLQNSVTTPDGHILRPDAVINYSEGRKIVIDSKVSIQAYLRMLSSESADERQALAREHVASVKKHVAELKAKDYQQYVGTDRKIDFVLMFIPHEGAYLAAMQMDAKLWENAYDSRVLIISPTHLVSVVRLIEQLWRHDRQNRNALEIASQAGAMLDKFRGFLEDMDRMDKSINASRDAWNAAYNKLVSGTGNLVNRAGNLRELGAKLKKEFPQRYLPQQEETEE